MDKQQLTGRIAANTEAKDKKRPGVTTAVVTIAGLVVAGVVGFTVYAFMQNMASENNDKVLKQHAIDASPKSSLKGHVQTETDKNGGANGIGSDSDPESLLSYGMPRSKVELLIGEPQGGCSPVDGGTNAVEKCLYNGAVKSVTYKDGKLDSAEFSNGNTLTKNSGTRSLN